MIIFLRSILMFMGMNSTSPNKELYRLTPDNTAALEGKKKEEISSEKDLKKKSLKWRNWLT